MEMWTRSHPDPIKGGKQNPSAWGNRGAEDIRKPCQSLDVILSQAKSAFKGFNRVERINLSLGCFGDFQVNGRVTFEWMSERRMWQGESDGIVVSAI